MLPGIMHGSSGCLLLAFVGCVLAAERNGRWFDREIRTTTKIIKEKQLWTERTPSSCVVVQTSLPACRHLRAVSIQPTQSVQMMQTQAPVNQGWQPIVHSSDPIPPTPESLAASTPQPPSTTTPTSSWGWNLFNFNLIPKDVTVTQTLRETYTTTYMDPNTVVTFSVKGCRPSRLPFDLPECHPPHTVTPAPEGVEKGIIVMAPIQFVPPLAPIRTSETLKEENIESGKNEGGDKNKEEKKNE